MTTRADAPPTAPMAMADVKKQPATQKRLAKTQAKEKAAAKPTV